MLQIIEREEYWRKFLLGSEEWLEKYDNSKIAYLYSDD